jgi:hypothetical protein
VKSHLERQSTLLFVVAIAQAAHQILDLVNPHGGQETQLPQVAADDGDVARPREPRPAKQRSVSTQGEKKIQFIHLVLERWTVAARLGQQVSRKDQFSPYLLGRFPQTIEDVVKGWMMRL